MPQRGLLIVIEGLDRSGKSTQCDLLTKHLSTTVSTETRLVKFPDRTTPTGQIINQYLTTTTNTSTKTSDHAIHLLFSANRWEAVPSLISTLSQGINIVVDRYSFSGAVYSAAKSLSNLDLEWAWAPEIGLPKPDLVVFLSVDEGIQRERGGYGEERYETVEMQRKVRDGFAGLWGRLDGDSGVNLRVVDASGSVDEVEGRVWDVVKDILIGQRGELGVLGALK